MMEARQLGHGQRFLSGYLKGENFCVLCKYSTKKILNREGFCYLPWFLDVSWMHLVFPMIPGTDDL